MKTKLTEEKAEVDVAPVSDKKKSFSFPKKTKLILSLVASAVVLITVTCIVIFAPSGKTSFSIETSLKEVFDISEFSTVEYTYNSIAKIKIDPKGSDDEKNIKFYVSYKGVVKAGFDFKDIKIEETETKTYIIIPEIELQCADPSGFDFIFTKEKYNNEETTMKEALKGCKEDLVNKAKNNKSLKALAVESAIETVTALTKPFEKHLEEGKSFEIVYVDNYKPEVTK